jgi:hypothetical protein
MSNRHLGIDFMQMRHSRHRQKRLSDGRIDELSLSPNLSSRGTVSHTDWLLC